MIGIGSLVLAPGGWVGLIVRSDCVKIDILWLWSGFQIEIVVDYPRSLVEFNANKKIWEIIE